MTKRIVLNPFSIDSSAHAKQHGIEFNDETLTIQSDRDQSDINNIVKQFGLTQQLPYGQSVPRYDDYTDTPNDYHSALNFIKDSESLFMEYPAEVRTKFNNDPGEFLSFVSNDKNHDEAHKLGFTLNPPVEASTPKTEDSASLKDAPAAQSST